MKTIREISIDTSLIYQRLTKAEIGEIIGYADLTQLIDRDVQKQARSNLDSALRKALSDGLVFETIRNIGIKRLGDNDIAKTGVYTIQKIRRVAKKGMKKLASVKDFDKMENGAKTQHNLSFSVLGVFSHMTANKTINKFEKIVSDHRDKFSVNKTLELFK